jgi:DNA-binding beta-propeller fold protein YncE
MRIPSALTFTSLSSIFLLTACAGSAPILSSGSPSAVAPDAAALPYAGSAFVRQKWGRTTPATLPNDLYVLEYDFVNHCDCPIVDILDRRYRSIGRITSGFSEFISDATVDASGNVYVADDYPANVVEYAPGQWSAPSFTYNANMADPIAVKADKDGNVYETDGVTPFPINEYHQATNSVAASCDSNGEVPAGLAVDSSGDVFVALQNSTSTLDIWEYAGGLGPSCAHKVLPVSGTIAATPNDPHGMALDENRNLLLATGYEVAVIDPPYTAVNGTIGSGFARTLNVSLNRNNTLAFVTDLFNETVTVVSYPSGTNVKVLSFPPTGEYEPAAAVSSRNAVY